MEEKSLHSIQLAGLLHDIGTFIQYSSSTENGGESKHPNISRDFILCYKDVFSQYVDDSVLVELVQRHHENPLFPKELLAQEASPGNRQLCLLLSQANSMSSLEHDEEDDSFRDYKDTPLSSIFAQLQLYDEKARPVPKVYRPLPLKPKDAFPYEDKSLDKTYSKELSVLVENFKKDFSQLADESRELQFETFFSRLTALLQKYTWPVPSNTQEKNHDISLYDHLKTTSAIAAALYLYHQEKDDFADESMCNLNENKFRLVVGDLSGIQSFIFSGLAKTSKGAAKSLRARSFILSSIGEVVTYRILKEFGLNKVNVLMSSGGNFHLLLPNLEDSESRINHLQKELDALMMERFQGEVGLNLGQVEFNGFAFRRFDEVLSAANQVLASRKVKQFNQILIENKAWIEDQFHLEFKGDPEKGICQGCGQAFTAIEEEVSLCRYCFSEREFGKKLAQAKYLYFYEKPFATKGKFHLLGDYWIVPTKDVLIEKDQPFFVLSLNETNLRRLKCPCGFRYVTNHIPSDEEKDEVLDFDTIASFARGRELLGYLKADVDNLGALFFCGLYEDETTNRNSISRLATLSRMLDLFFAGYINYLLSEKYPHCYAVFSGGDDLFLIGPWNEIIDLANDVQNDFRRFVNDNWNITLSTGVFVCKPTFPIGRAAEIADDCLEKAKETVLKGRTEGRDQIHIFGRTIKWEDFPILLEEAKKLVAMVEKEDIPHAFIYRLLDYEALFQRYYRDGLMEGLRYIPLLMYDIARNFKPEAKEAIAWVEELKDINKKKTIYLRFILEYVINQTRRGLNGELQELRQTH